MRNLLKNLAILFISLTSSLNIQAQTVGCNRSCLQEIAETYLSAYLAHDPSLAPIAQDVMFTENYVRMPFPDASWDTVSEEVGPHFTLLDTLTSQLAIFTPIMQNDIPGFLAVRLRVSGDRVTEIEHIISTRRNLSNPPTPIGDHADYAIDPVINDVIPIEQRLPRELLEAHARGYFSTLQGNDGEIRGTCFYPDAIRRENGLLFTDIEGGFRSGRYRFNNEVRNWPVLVDEELGIAMSRGFIDHKGVLVDYALTDGTPQRSVFREPQTWGFLEMFKVKEDCIASVVATFIQSPYKMDSPWNPR
jgi:hypothetical protein